MNLGLKQAYDRTMTQAENIEHPHKCFSMGAGKCLICGKRKREWVNVGCEGCSYCHPYAYDGVNEDCPMAERAKKAREQMAKGYAMTTDDRGILG